MRVSKLSIWVMCLAMVLNSLTLFSFASERVALNNSGSTEISMMAMRSVAASEGVALTAAEGDSGQFGYNIEPFPASPYLTDYRPDYLTYYEVFNLPGGTYIYSLEMVSSFRVLNVYNFADSSLLFRNVVDSNDAQISFTLDSPTVVQIVAYNGSGFDSNSFVKSSISTLKPVEGISSGYTFDYVNNPSLQQIDSYLETSVWDFGNQPAGNYIINIYTYGQNYDVNFDIAVGDDVASGRKLAVAKSNGLYTCLVSHGGGDLILSSNFTYSHDTQNAIAPSSSFGGQLVNSNVNVYGGTWAFHISDVVAVPLESSGLEQFGIFGAIVGYLRDEFSSMKAWIATQIDKIAGDDATQADVDSASSALQKEVEEVNELSNNLSSQTSNLEQQFTTDFAVPDEVTDSSGTIQSIYTSIFGFLGAFSIFIWLPVVFAVIKKLLRL